ncbi:hypothetical protein ONE63_011448 [Megalurothrips usitatus]|uniref:RNA-directed DNA polymerase n=1 Tax=Megalurothrips usitatus TaxID=439358 RepID=A0AAV7X4J7_9NEOP|nr:hypothetical protein ONE63_011448 [Megalurothrips usitatus]
MPSEAEWQQELARLSEANAKLHELTQQQMQALALAQAAAVEQQQQLDALRQQQPQVGAVAVKLPAFWADRPALWFVQVDAQFALARITAPTTMYRHVVAQLDSRMAAEVEDILTGPPEGQTYENLKKQLIARLSLSEERRINQLLAEEDIGDRTPSQFLRHLRALAGGSAAVNDAVMKRIWTRRLPSHVTAILASQPDLGLDKLAPLADRVLEAAPGIPSVHAVSTAAAPGPVDALAKMIETLAGRVEALTQQSRSRPRGRSRSRNNNNDGGGARGGSDSGLCWYHERRLLTGRRHVKTNYALSAANNSNIATYGLFLLKLNLPGLRRDLTWSFIVADVSVPIIGSDFLAHYHLLPDCKLKRLHDATTGLFADCQSRSIAQPSVRAVAVDLPGANILAEFPDVTRPAGRPREMKHHTEHFIKTTPGPPVSCKPRRLAGERLTVAKGEFDAMVQEGTARPSDSPWSSPLHIVGKKGGSGWRPCGDYRALNARTVPDSYPVRHIQDFGNSISGSKVFSSIDLVKAYQQIPVNVDDVPKTAITTPFGLYEFPFMTFGLRNAAQTFQRFMDEVLRGLDFVYSYIDDVLVFSRTPEEHTAHLRQLFERLSQYGVVVNPAKCVFAAPELVFLGHSVSADGICPPAERVAALRAYPRPETTRDLRRFLGMINFYRRHVPRAAEFQAPLHDLLARPGLRKNDAVPWTPELEAAFQSCKDALATATMLAYPVTGAPLSLYTDASLRCVGAVLQQLVDGELQPLAFFSKKISAGQSTWPPFHRELLGIYEAVYHFRHFLEGQDFCIFTDHKPLTCLFAQKHDKIPPVQRNHLTYISQFCTDIRHVNGAENVVADALSRVEAIQLPAVDPQALADAQHHDDDLRTWPADASLKLEKVPVPGTNLELWCDTSAGRPRPFVPAPLRRRVFRQLHDLSHPGKRPTTRLVADRYVWPGLRKDVATWVRACVPCQRAKITRYTRAPVGRFAAPTARFGHVHVDIIGRLTPSRGFAYCLTCVDRWTRWPEVIPMKDITAETVALAFMTGWVARFGTPERITVDRGSQFTSVLFHSLAGAFGAKVSHTTSYHPQANGQVECLHRPLKAAITAHDDIFWVEALPVVLLGLRSALKEDIAASSAEMVYGEPLRLPGDMFTDTTTTAANPIGVLTRLRQHFAKVRPTPASRHAKPGVFVHRDLATCTHVFLEISRLRRSLTPPWSDPHEVLARSKDGKTLTVRLNGAPSEVTVDRVKPAYLCTDGPVAGRPPIAPEVPEQPTCDPSARANPPRRVRFKGVYTAGIGTS